MAKGKTHEDFINEMKIKHPNIKIISKYTKMREKVRWICEIHNIEGETRADSLLKNKHICKECIKESLKDNENIKQGHIKQRKPHDKFVEEMKIINPNIEILGQYINRSTKIKCRCLIDDNIFFMTPRNLLDGQNCPKCAMIQRILKKSKSHEDFIKELKEINPNIEILNKYINAKTIMECRCLVDGHEWKSNVDNLLRGHGCPECAIRNNTGENNYNWNPNLTQEDREDKRNYPEYKEWRTKCFERDNYTCQVTGKRGVELAVHHLYSYNKYYCLRTTMENGITVSKEIHELFHKKYGRGNNTLEQWEEFIKSLK